MMLMVRNNESSLDNVSQYDSNNIADEEMLLTRTEDVGVLGFQLGGIGSGACST